MANNLFDRILNPLGYIRKNGAIDVIQGSSIIEKSNTEPQAVSISPNLMPSYIGMQKGIKKPTPISFETLRKLSKASAVARICINTLKHEITQVKWAIVPEDPKKESINDPRIQELTRFFKQPNRNNETFRTFLDKTIEDLLVLDAVAIEKVNDMKGRPAEMYYVDAATIRPCFDKHGMQADPAYVQYMTTNATGKPDAEWTKDEMIYFMQNPQYDVKNYGYGLSPLEGIIMVVTNMLNAENYNGSYFDVGTIPQIMLHLGSNVTPEDVNSFREYWITEIEGKPWKTAIMGGGEKPDMMKLQETNRDMQFMEYQMWLLKLIVAAYEMSPQDIGFTMDINKAVGEVQQQISKSQGFRSILSLMKEYYTQEIIHEWFGYTDLLFEWQDLDIMSPKELAEIAAIEVPKGLKTINEYRKTIGLDPVEGGDKPMIITGNGINYLEAISSQNEQQQEILEGVDTDTQKSHNKEEFIEKTVTIGDHICWVDDTGYSQPFVCTDKMQMAGYVIKPPVAIDLDGPYIEEKLSQEAIALGLNVPFCKNVAIDELNEYFASGEVADAFDRYKTMAPDFYSRKWQEMFGMSREFSFYNVIEFIPGRKLNDKRLIEDMKRDPESYVIAIKDIAALWIWEKSKYIGDRRSNQYIITPSKRGYGIDYQTEDSGYYWDKTKSAIYDILITEVPYLANVFLTEIGDAWTEEDTN